MQRSFSEFEYAAKKRVTRRGRFLGDIDAVTPWPALVAELELFYPKGEGRGRPPIGLEPMLRVVTTAANVSDITQAHALLHGEGSLAFGDAGYQGAETRPEHKGTDTTWHVAICNGRRKVCCRTPKWGD